MYKTKLKFIKKYTQIYKTETELIKYLKNTKHYKRNYRKYRYYGKKYLKMYKNENIKNYKLGLNYWKTAGAYCDTDKKEISFSVYYLSHKDCTVKETMLHEISHALTETQSQRPHDKIWKKCYKSIGGNGKIECPNFIDDKNSKYILTCSKGCKEYPQKLPKNYILYCKPHEKRFEIRKNY